MGLEKIIKELNSEKKKQEKRVVSSLNIIKKYLCDIYSSGNIQEVSQCQQKVNNFLNYVKQEFGIDIPTQKEKDDRLKEQESILMKALQIYQVGQSILKSELSQKTELSLRQLSAYTTGKNPFIINENKDHYKLVRPITKEQALEARTDEKSF